VYGCLGKKLGKGLDNGALREKLGIKHNETFSKYPMGKEEWAKHLLEREALKVEKRKQADNSKPKKALKYRVCCALATQSLASLRYAFPHEKGSQAINILITNTGTKLFFRTTDSSTADTLLNLIPEPHRQDRPHVVRVLPPSTLQPGECYYVLVNGTSGRGQVMVGK
jgi:hypothetical protein